MKIRLEKKNIKIFRKHVIIKVLKFYNISFFQKYLSHFTSVLTSAISQATSEHPLLKTFFFLFENERFYNKFITHLIYLKIFYFQLSTFLLGNFYILYFLQIKFYELKKKKRFNNNYLLKKRKRKH